MVGLLARSHLHAARGEPRRRQKLRKPCRTHRGRVRFGQNRMRRQDVSWCIGGAEGLFMMYPSSDVVGGDLGLGYVFVMFRCCMLVICLRDLLPLDDS